MLATCIRNQITQKRIVRFGISTELQPKLFTSTYSVHDARHHSTNQLQTSCNSHFSRLTLQQPKKLCLVLAHLNQILSQLIEMTYSNRARQERVGASIQCPEYMQEIEAKLR